MNQFITFLVLLSASLASSAQSLAPAPAAVEASKSQVVASPNRMTAAALAALSKATNKHGHHQAHDTAAALRWVDSTGKTLGRAVGAGTALVSYNGELLMMGGLEAIFGCVDPAQVDCTYRAGTDWSPYFASSAYTSADCSGAAYSSFLTGATPYGSIPVVEDGIPYIYITRMADVALIPIRSYLLNGGCRVSPSGIGETFAAPVFAVEQAALFGTAPFFQK